MTNREWLDRKDNDFLANRFCYELAKGDGDFCEKYCPFSELCKGGESGFKVWLEQENRGDL